MDINKQENFVENPNAQRISELKIINGNDSKKENSEEEIPTEAELYIDKPKTEEKEIDDVVKMKDFIFDLNQEPAQPIGKKIMKSLLLSLNPYWIGLLASIALIISLLIFSILALLAGNLVLSLFEEGESTMEAIKITYEFVIKKLGLKWYMFIIICNNLSIGFFCLTTISNIFKDIKNIKTFFIVNCIGTIIYYALSVVILKVIIKDLIGNFIKEKIIETKIKTQEIIIGYANDLVDQFQNIIAILLGNYNIWMEKLIVGCLYLFLFYENEKNQINKLTFRLCASIPILYIIVCLVLRALQNTNILRINEFISPLLLGLKINIYLFFIILFLVIKYKSLTYNIFDGENYIQTIVFTKIGSRVFGIIGVFELIIGLFIPSLSSIGIGKYYLIFLCALITALYDYKKVYILRFPCCKERNMTLCLKIAILFIGFSFLILIGGAALSTGAQILIKYIIPILEFVNDHLEDVGIIINLFI